MKSFQKKWALAGTEELDGGPIEIVVSPIGWNQVKQLTGVIVSSTSLMAKLRDVAKTPEASAGLASLVPFIMENVLDLMWDNVIIKDARGEVISESDLPHWFIPEVVEEWLKLNFDEEIKWRPWVGAIETAVTKATGEAFTISDILSNSSSETVIPDTTSSTVPE